MFALDTYLPYKRNYKTIDGFRMHYVDEGTGPVVVLLHGNPTWCFYFRNLIKELSSSFRVIAPDYIGCGLSDHPENVHYRAVDRMRQVQDLLDSLGVNKLSLVMHDWGGPIGTGFAVRNPERIERIVYLNTTLTETESLPFIIKRAAAPYIGKVLTKYTRNFLKITTELGVFKKLPRAVQEGYFYPYQTSARRTAIWDFVQDIPFSSTHPTYSEMFDMAERIPLLKHVPVHIIWGMRDPCFHREMLSKVVGHFPHATVQELKDASHLLLEDAPDTVIPAIKSFLLGEARPVGLVGASQEGQRSDPFNSAIQSLARERGDHDAVVVPTCFGESITYSHTTYRQFEALILKYARGLAELGLQQGDKVVMLVPPSVDFLALSFACIDRGAVPVFLDPGMGIDNLKRSIKEIRPAVFMGSVKAQILRLMNRDVFEGLKFSITAIDLPIPGVYTLSFLRKFAPLRLPAVAPGPISLIAFTSGATGAPKGVEYTPAMVDAVLDILRRQFGLQAGTRDMPMLPIFSLFNVALGVTSVFPPVDPSAPLSLDPIRIVRIVNDLSINYSFGSPTLWTKIAEYCVRSAQKLESIEKVFMAGAPVPEKTLALVQGVLPRGTAFTPYGATEVLPVTLVSSPQLVHADPVRAVTGEEGTFVGMPVHGVVVKIIRAVQEPIVEISGVEELPVQTIGEIIVKGSNISGAYFQNDTATTNAKIRDGAGFWHRMGDVGYLDEAGNLYFCGRKAHVVASYERTYYSDPVERVFNRHQWVRRSALIPVEGGKDAAVAIEPLPQHFPTESKDRAAFIAELREIGKRDPLTSQIEKFFFHPSFPVDARHNAKIFRDKLGRWADEMTHKGSDV